MHRLILLLFLPLLACANPQATCERAVARELETLEELIEETRLNLARGYTYEMVPRPVRAGLTLCSGGDNVLFCTGNYGGGAYRRAEAVDPAAERRKLERLQARQQELLTRGTAACAARADGL